MCNIKNVKKQLFLLGLLPILIGGFLYILFRSEHLTMFRWFKALSLNHGISFLRTISNHFVGNLPDWFLYSLPDGLYLFSFTSFLLIIWNYELSIKSALFIFSVPFLAIISEGFQHIGLFPGTFDELDLFYYISGIFISVLTVNPTFQKSTNALNHKYFKSIGVIFTYLVLAYAANIENYENPHFGIF